MFPLVEFVILAYYAQAGLSAPATYDQRQAGDLNVQVHLKDVKIVAFVDSELLQDYTDYDYFYDYADFTIKPIGGKPTTAKPTSVEPGSTLSSNGSTVESSSTTERATTESGSFSPQNVSESADTENVTELTENAERPSVESSTKIDDSSTEKIPPSNREAESMQVLEEASNGTVKYRINDKAGNLFDAEDVLLTSEDTSSEAESSVVHAKPVPGQQSRKRCRSGYMPDGKGRCRRLNRRRVTFVPIVMKLAPTPLANETNYAKAAA